MAAPCNGGLGELLAFLAVSNEYDSVGHRDRRYWREGVKREQRPSSQQGEDGNDGGQEECADQPRCHCGR